MQKLTNMALFVDFKKSFDYVNSDLLLVKLRCYGFDSNALELFSNYFRQRKQYVSFKNITSSIVEILLGVPQGSILGPLLFLIFINDLIFDFNEIGNCVLFADDTTIHVSGKEQLQCIDQLRIEVDKLKSWCSFNRLQVNWDKTYIMPIVSSRAIKTMNFEHEYSFGDDVVRVVKVFKLLGVHLDCTLSFVTNVEETCKKVRGALFSLKSKFFLSFETKLQFFKTFILPHFDYCISLAIYYTTELRMSLVKLYNFCLRKLGLLRLDKFEHVRDIDTMAFNSLLRKQGLFSFGFRVFYRLSLFIHKVFNQSNASALRDCFLKTTHRYGLRHTQRFNVAVSRRVCDDMNFFLFAPKYINYLFIDTIYYNFIDFKTFLLCNLDNLYEKFHVKFLFFSF